MKTSFVVIVALLGLIVVGTSSSLATASASGSDPIFMKIPGIDGDVNAVGHEKEIQLNSFQFGASNPVISSSGGGAGKVSISEIAVTKIMDKSSPLLFKNVATGAHIPQVDIFFVKTGSSSGLQTYAHYILKNVILSSYSVSSGGDIPSESLSINFAQIQFEFTPTNSDGSIGSTITAGWDLALNKEI